MVPGVDVADVQRLGVHRMRHHRTSDAGPVTCTVSGDTLVSATCRSGGGLPLSRRRTGTDLCPTRSISSVTCDGLMRTTLHAARQVQRLGVDTKHRRPGAHAVEVQPDRQPVAIDPAQQGARPADTQIDEVDPRAGDHQVGGNVAQLERHLQRLLRIAFAEVDEEPQAEGDQQRQQLEREVARHHLTQALRVEQRGAQRRHTRHRLHAFEPLHALQQLLQRRCAACRRRRRA